MTASNKLINVTFIDVSVRGPQESCLYFWGSTKDRNSNLEMDLRLEELKSQLEKQDPPINPGDLDSEDILCAYINFRWHRVRKSVKPECESKNTGMLEVFCVDSGKTHQVHLNTIRTLDIGDIAGCEPKEICTARFIRNCPPLAEKFVLVDVFTTFDYTTLTRQWSDLAKQFFKANIEGRVWEAIPVAMYGEHQGVRLIDSNNRLLADVLIEEKFAGPATFEHCEGELPFYPSAVLSNTPRIAFLKSPFGLPTKGQPTPGKKLVKVVYVDDPSSFRIHFFHSGNSLVRFGLRLHKFYSEESRPSIKDPRVGAACVARNDQDGIWYRGQILKLCDRLRANVLFFDYGNTQLVPIGEIKSIDAEFMQVPSFAYHCRLGGVASFRVWTQEEIREFASRTRDKVLYATFTNPDSEGKYPVRLVEDTATGAIVFNEEFAAPRYKSSSVPDKPISVVIACYPVVSFQDRTISFHIAPVDAGLQQEKLQKLDRFYDSLSPNDLHEDLPRPGTPCVARYTEDGRYYRAVILSIVDEIANILFVDYGNHQKTPLSALKRITPGYMELPPMAWQCKLKGVKFIPICPEFMEYFDRCFGTDEELSASFHAPTLGDCGGLLEVDLSVPKIGDVSQFLLEKHVVERVSKEGDVE